MKVRFQFALLFVGVEMTPLPKLAHAKLAYAMRFGSSGDRGSMDLRVVTGHNCGADVASTSHALWQLRSSAMVAAMLPVTAAMVASTTHALW